MAWKGQEFVYDAIVLEVMLPGIDGFDVAGGCAKRAGGRPSLWLTARVAVDERIRALDAGADDYLAKRFSQLAARVRS